MRVLSGSKIVDVEDLPDLEGRRVVIDVGSGDGRFPYERARADPASFYIGLDPDAGALAEYAHRATRKPARGGVANVLFVVASVEDPPKELSAAADLVCVNFPWAGLLRGLLLAAPAAIGGLLRLARPGAAFEISLTFDREHDAGVFGEADAPALDLDYVDRVLVPAYAKLGLDLTGARELSRDEALAVPSTWGRRLLHARPRRVFQVLARKIDVGRSL